MVESVAECLSRSLYGKNLTESKEWLDEATHKLQNDQINLGLLTSSIFQTLSKISVLYSESISISIGRLYLCLLARSDALNPALLPILCQKAIEISESIKGTSLSNSLLSHCHKSLLILKSPSSEVLEMLSLFNLPDISFTIQQITLQITENKIQGMSELIELLSSFSKVETQYKFIEQNFKEIILAITKVNNIDIIKVLLGILQTIIFEYKFNVILQEGTPGVLYEIDTHRIPESIFDVILLALDSITVYEVETSQQCIEIIRNLWNRFPNRQKELQNITVTVFVDIINEGSSLYKTISSNFLFDVMHSADSAFRELLESDKRLRPLFESDDYRPSNLLTCNLFSIPTNIGFASSVDIPPGEDYFLCIEATAPNSILIWGFATKHYDIGFSISLIDPFSSIFAETRYTCNEKPQTGSCLLATPGLYKVNFINSYSWFKGKQIRYRVILLKPQITHQKALEKPMIETICENRVTVGMASIGVWVKKNIEVVCLGNLTEINSLQEVYKVANMLPEASNYAIGVVGKPPVYVPRLDVPNMYVCADADALALIGIEMYADRTIIAVVCEMGTRVSIAFQRRILYSNDSKTALAEEVGRALSVFGPAIVLLAGTEAPEIKILEKELEEYVDKQVAFSTFVRLSNDLVFTAAGKLGSYSKTLFKGN